MLAGVSLRSLLRRKHHPGSGCPSGQPLAQVTSAPRGLGFKTPAQLGSSFFSFVNYFALAPWLGLCLLGLPGVQWPGWAPAGPPPSPARLLLPPPPSGEAAKAQESWPARGGSGRRVALRKRLQM